MSDEQIYEVLVKDGSQILRYLMKAKIVEFWAEPEEKEKLEIMFREAHYNKGIYEILEIRPSDFIDIITVKK